MKPVSRKRGAPRPRKGELSEVGSPHKPIPAATAGPAQVDPEAGAGVRQARLLEQLQEQQHLLELRNEQLGEVQAELEKSSHRYADLYDGAPLGFMTLDGRGCIREINQTACEVLGLTARHLMGRPLVPHVAAPDRKVLLKHLWESRRSPEQVITRLTLTGPGGRERHVQFVTRRVEPLGSRSVWCRTAIVDITGQLVAEAALSASEAKFRLLAENMGEVFWFLELDPFHVSYVSPAFERIWGVPVKELYADHAVWEKSIHPDDLAEVKAGFRRWLEGETKQYTNEYRVVHRDGSLRWIADRGLMISDRHGRPCRMSGLARDVTERKQAELELAEKATQLKAVFEAVCDGILIADAETRRLVFGNAAMHRMLGVSEEELPTLGVESIHPIEALPSLGVKFAAIAEGTLSRVDNAPLMRKDGHVVPVDISGATVVIGGRRCVVGVFHDLTERHRAEHKFRTLLESAPDAMMIHDGQGRIEIVNSQAEVLFGHTRDQMIGQTMEMLMPERLRRGHRKLRESHAPSAKPRPMGTSGMTMVALHKDGREIPVEISLSNLADAESPMVISSIRDITERQRAEESVRQSQRFSQATLEAVPAHVAVLDQDGTIISINESWKTFALAGNTAPSSATLGDNYLLQCQMATGQGFEEAARFAEGIGQVLSGSANRFSMELPCHQGHHEHHFVGYVSAFPGEGPRRAVIAFVDISSRKRAERVIRRLNEELELRVAQRTEALRKANEELRQEIAMRRRLEEEILEISEREQQRIGQDLHDDLGQQLAGIWCLGQILERNLAGTQAKEAVEAKKINELIKDALALTRSLAKGLHPVALQAGGLVTALRELQQHVKDVFRVRCGFTCPEHIEVGNTTATHLYRIAQEAVTNAIKHGHAAEVEIRLAADAKRLVLSIRDNGSGLPEVGARGHGMGLPIMHYRADLIGGALDIKNNLEGSGAMVTCDLPIPPVREPWN